METAIEIRKSLCSAGTYGAASDNQGVFCRFPDWQGHRRMENEGTDGLCEGAELRPGRRKPGRKEGRGTDHGGGQSDGGGCEA